VFYGIVDAAFGCSNGCNRGHILTERSHPAVMTARGVLAMHEMPPLCPVVCSCSVYIIQHDIAMVQATLAQ
jgi:hypothetical protein